MAPEISVVIPTHNRRERLRACLESLAQQTVSPDDFEVVVAVDGSTDGTEEMLGGLSMPYVLQVVTQPHSGPGGASNRAADAAQGRFVLLLDDDMVASPGLVAAHLEAQRLEKGIAGIGVIVRRLPPQPDRLTCLRAEQWRAYYEGLSGRPATLRDANSGNLSLEREAFRRVGGFATDVPIEKDTELALRLHEAGVAFRYITGAVATEDVRDDWRRIVRQEVQRGRIALDLYRRRPAILPWLPLGGRVEEGRRASALRALLLNLRVPPLVVTRFALLAPGESSSRKALGFTYTYAYWAGVKRSADPDMWRRLRRGLPILMYHAVGAADERPSRYVVPVKRLERQLRWLARRRYAVIALDEYLRLRSEFRLPPPKSVVITFDDGYRDNLSLARPVLERFGSPTTIFLISAAGDTKRSSDDALAGRSLMSLEEARSALGGVISFGAHSRTHPRLPELSAAEVEHEVAGSKQELEAALGVRMPAFAYPYGKFDDSVQRIVEGAGFAGAVSVHSGRNRPATDSFALRRIEIYGTYSLLRFALTIWLGEIRFGRAPK